MDNFCYFKKTGRYAAIPLVIGLYDDAANAVPVKVKKSNYTSRWNTQSKKVADFNEQYPEVSKGDLYVSRMKNQLVTYTPYTYMNAKKTATGEIPLLYTISPAPLIIDALSGLTQIHTLTQQASATNISSITSPYQHPHLLLMWILCAI